MLYLHKRSMDGFLVQPSSLLLIFTENSPPSEVFLLNRFQARVSMKLEPNIKVCECLGRKQISTKVAGSGRIKHCISLL